MYHWLYNLGIQAYTGAIGMACLFSQKARYWQRGRKNIWQKLGEDFSGDQKVIWFHAASLGEAEQGVPIMQEVKQRYPEFRILLTFFSPSGMHNFQRKDLVDHLYYLPADRPGSAEKFVSITRPSLAFFIKYEIWANYFLALQKRHIPIIIAPAIFRADQFYFRKPHSSFFIPILKKVSAILTQDETSVTILKEHGIANCERVGDSRFEKVLQNTRQKFSDPVLESFSEAAPTLVAGSTWPPDEQLLLAVARTFTQLKMILAPHDISPGNIARLRKALGSENSFLYSQPPADPAACRYAIIDNIGLLSRIYRLGQLAYIGGAFGKGIHNSLEAVAYGLPVFFGPNHQNFVEPKEMLVGGFAHEVKDAPDLIAAVGALLDKPGEMKRQSEGASQYVAQGTGAVVKIMKVADQLLG